MAGYNGLYNRYIKRAIYYSATQKLVRGETISIFQLWQLPAGFYLRG